MLVLKTTVQLAGMFTAAVLAGFIGFVLTIEFVERAPSGRADGIVALSGDPQRVHKALELLAQNYGKRLLIVGVDNADEIVRLYAAHRALFECCVQVDQSSRNTTEDATQTRRWVQEHRLRSIFVVTSNFHITRALIELDHALPAVRKIPYPVVTEMADLLHWWRRPRALKLMGREYAKLLIAWFRTRLVGLTRFRGRVAA